MHVEPDAQIFLGDELEQGVVVHELRTGRIHEGSAVRQGAQDIAIDDAPRPIGELEVHREHVRLACELDR